MASESDCKKLISHRPFLPISDELKAKLKDHLSSVSSTSTEPASEPRIVEIVDENE